MKIVCDSLGNVYKYLISSFYFDVLLLNFRIADITIRVVFNGKSAECFFEFVAVGFFVNF